MPTSAFFHESASTLNPLHLLRALLREASYLPDATARTYFRRYIVSRFKAYQPKSNATASFDVEAVERYEHKSFKRRKMAVIRERARPLLRKGLKGLNYMRRANQGEMPCLEKILYFTYGRMGRRKFLLMTDLLKPDPIMDEDAAHGPSTGDEPPLQKLYYSDKRYLQFFDKPVATSKTHYTINISDRYSRLRQVLKTQYQKGISINRELKSPVLKTPINNVWERPMPMVRARNNIKRWYAMTMTRLLPPLPTDEWDKIHAMIVGDERVSLVKRRVRVPTKDSVPEQVRFASTVDAAMALDKPTKADKPAGAQRPHSITPKYMRRIYARVHRLCCKVEYDDEQKQWKPIWGEHRNTIKPKIYQLPTDEALFAGVNAAGQVVKAQKKHAVDASSHVQPRDADGNYMRFPFFAEFLPEDNPIRKDLDEWKRKRRVAQEQNKA
ncbi:Complex1-LYR multi-domain protein [Pyrenophora tritici-repentis]|uniref:Complex 1 protein n=2 Tax=Pyrenophora tritici-repentis TaxID=45151 RepID=A0A2W1H2N1_9PLEO|nr:uncharacterized protein PTRG_05286 [Pyrenophora tritici-repentis Pt-1C-BFP]KAA8611533.1 Complex1-LYR multi-domain protein [Pyrenophora tritici-repentis]EDU48193.1 conserved hypothetical protein [Pyrenophora tritici-repentis Pt-1C-BFP]KAF7447568.1 Complex1-LYR multi-domain protein [Pyrenophora tritici-repentis]KAI0570338.1 Complex1-LYR multi-domain protein [Pyrenophora tritici-repentis]KAI0573976.1 Complex1-LYR multi-domain protein [Pyrenophora tritici-repentis]